MCLVYKIIFRGSIFLIMFLEHSTNSHKIKTLQSSHYLSIILHFIILFIVRYIFQYLFYYYYLLLDIFFTNISNIKHQTLISILTLIYYNIDTLLININIDINLLQYLFYYYYYYSSYY